MALSGCPVCEPSPCSGGHWDRAIEKLSEKNAEANLAAHRRQASEYAKVSAERVLATAAPVSDPSETPLGGLCPCDVGPPHVRSSQPSNHAQAALETLALMAEHRPNLQPVRGTEWCAWTGSAMGEGATIGDAVRACVAKIKGQ
jgi:hypothetical protein